MLSGWLDELCKLRDNLQDLAMLDQATIRERPPVSWEVGFRPGGDGGLDRLRARRLT